MSRAGRVFIGAALSCIGFVLYFSGWADGLGRIQVSAFKPASAQSKSMPETPKMEDKKSEKKESSDGYLEGLASRKEALDKREVELKKMEEELLKQKGEIAKKMQELETMRQNISDILKDRVVMDNERINRLVDFYSNMKPANAAKVFESLDEELAMEILGRMKKQSAAAILNKLSADRAQKLSEKYAGYRSGK